MIRKNKMQHLIELARDGSVVYSYITDEEAEYLRKEGFKVKRGRYKIYHIEKINKGDMR